jgi:hypothetical protein
MKAKPDEKEFMAVMKAMIDAWEAGTDYIADNDDQYFDYAVPLMHINNMKRIPPGIERRDPDGRKFMIDTYQGPNGNIIKMGYEMYD